MARLPKLDIVSTDDLTVAQIERILDLAQEFAKALEERRIPELAKGLIMATLFYEPSTRTRLSFETAMLRLGGATISSPDMRASSASKGESLADTARVVGRYADLLVLRHPCEGAARLAAQYAPGPVINAGDGGHEHPTQTLCDLYTLRRKKGRLSGLTVAVCGDLKAARTAHSLIYALARFGSNIIAASSLGMELPGYVLDRLAAQWGYQPETIAMAELGAVAGQLDALYLTPRAPHQMALFTGRTPLPAPASAAPRVFDAFYLTRSQRERHGEEAGEPAQYLRFDLDALRSSKAHDALVMHPLPRTGELAHEVDDDPRAVYFEQAGAGVPVRMALIAWMLEAAGAAEARPRGEEFVASAQGAPMSRCPNPTCITRHEPDYLQPRFRFAPRQVAGALRMQCAFCDQTLNVELVGHTTSRRYYRFDDRLYGYVRQWAEKQTLTVFESVKEAEERGYEPYRRGPQREILNAAEVAQACQALAEQIARDLNDPAAALLAGVVSRGALLALRLRDLIESRRGVRLGCAALDVYSRAAHLTSIDDGEDVGTEAKTIILVDDVINSGWTVQRAMTTLWRQGRPAALKLAVLIDRGHRTLPIRPNYVGKHIPTGAGERVTVRLAPPQADAAERAGERVVVYSLLESRREAEPRA
jgi:aspartate carbamoyltransferase catalytic subunit